MSEPRKLHTTGAAGSQYPAARPRQPGAGVPDQDQYEAARRRAQQLANQNARRRVVQQPAQTAQGRYIRQTPAQTPPQRPVEQPRRVQQAPPPADQAEAPRELTQAQRQAMAYRAAAERKYGNTVNFPAQRRPVRQPAQQGQPRAQVQNLDVRSTRGSKPAYDYDADTAPASGGIQMEAAATGKRRSQDSAGDGKSTYRSAKSGGSGGANRPKTAAARPQAKKAAKRMTAARAKARAKRKRRACGGRSCFRPSL